MADAIKVSVDMQDLKVLNDYLNTTEDKIDMTAKTAKKSFNQLKMAIDPAYRATKIFKDQVLVAQKAVATGAATQKEYATAFAQIQKQAAAAGVTINQFGQVADVNSRKLKRFGAVGMQQVGYQVQDFAVQVQGGTSMLVALGQQGSQLLGIFGPAGAIAGMILAIGTGLVGALLAAGDATKKLSENTEKLDDATTKLKGAFEILKMSGKDLEEMYGNMSASAATFAYAQAQILAVSTLKAFSDTNAGMGYALEGVLESSEALSPVFRDIATSLGDTSEAFNTAEKLQRDFATSFRSTGEDAVKAVSDISAVLNELPDETKRLLPEVLTTAFAELAEYQRKAIAANELLRKLKSGDFGGGDTSGKKSALQTLVEQLALEEALLGKSSARQRVIKALGVTFTETNPDIVNALTEQIKAIQDANAEMKKQQSLANSIANSFEDAMMSIVDNTKSVEDAFRQMAADIIKQLYRVLVVQQMVGSFDAASGEGSGLAGFIGGLLKPRANGGPVTAGQPYLVGERGPELFVPSSNGGVVANDKMGGGVTVVQNLNISTGVSQTVRAEIRNLMPQIAETAKSAVVDGKRRGGNYGKAFA